jgi:hypothetical protein
MKKLLLSAVAVLVLGQPADAQPYRAPYYPQPYARYAPPPYAYRSQPRGPNPLDFFGAFLSAIPMIAGAAPLQRDYQPPRTQPSYQPPQTQTQYDPRDPNLYLEEYRVTKQEVEAAMQWFCSEHGETVICRKIENMMRQGGPR